MLFKRKLSMWIFIIIVTLLGITAIALVINLNSLEKKHEEEIRKVISSNGGQVVKIEKETPKSVHLWRILTKAMLSIK